MDLRQVQARLAALDLYEGEPDGLYGPKTHAALDALFLARPYVDGNPAVWHRDRRVIAAAQLLCMLDGIEVGKIDGLMGPQTRQAFAIHGARKSGSKAEEIWRDVSTTSDDASAKGSASMWPRQAEVARFFGAVGANQTTLTLPFPMRIAWNKTQTITRASCHLKVAPALGTIWRRTLEHYGFEAIQQLGLDLFGGCLNVRKMRGGSAWSMHSWGIAWDVDPERNQLRWGRDRAELAKPAYEPFWGFVEDEGALSLGRTRNYDWMHLQFARL